MSFLDKKYMVTMSDGSKWAVPVRVIAESHAAYYLSLGDFVTMEQAMVSTMSDFEDEGEIRDWASNNMDWSEVEDFAEMVVEAPKIDWQEGWVNGDWEIIDE